MPGFTPFLRSRDVRILQHLPYLLCTRINASLVEKKCCAPDFFSNPHHSLLPSSPAFHRTSRRSLFAQFRELTPHNMMFVAQLPSKLVNCRDLRVACQYLSQALLD